MSRTATTTFINEIQKAQVEKYAALRGLRIGEFLRFSALAYIAKYPAKIKKVAEHEDEGESGRAVQP